MKRHIELSEKQKKEIYIISIMIFIVLMILLTICIGRPLVKYAFKPERFKNWIDSYGVYSRGIFVLIVMLQVVVAIIPGEPFEIAAGYCFGTIEGLILVLIGISIGSLIIFKLSDRYGESIISVFFKKKEFKKLNFLKDPRKAKNLAFILNVLPGTPKDLLSYFIGLTPIPLKTWLIIVFLGRIPSVISSTMAGDYLCRQEYKSTTNVFIITFIVSIIGLLIYNIIIKKNNKSED